MARGSKTDRAWPAHGQNRWRSSMTRSVRRLFVVMGVVLALLVPASVANAATATKAEVLYSWTQTSVTSYNAWNSARLNRTPWASYHFDWSTDYCSASPDQPLGYDFRL